MSVIHHCMLHTEHPGYNQISPKVSKKHM